MSYAAYLLDIEGTTTPIDFVAKTLFPFARREMERYLKEHAEDPRLGEDLSLLAQEHEFDAEAGAEWNGIPDPSEALPYLIWLMDVDRKSRALKSIQGRIWQEGYRTGILQGEVYPDVVPAIQRWKQRGASIYIYSSGSVLAQKLLFGSLPSGDLTPLISGFFDTEIGPKREAESYRSIARHIVSGPALFLSDILAEIEAARQAGFDATQIVRDGKTPETQPSAIDFSGF